jgi:hypothetical protein
MEVTDIVDLNSPLKHSVNTVCKVCNEGWIERCETAVNPILNNLRQTRPITLSRRHQGALARWATMAAMVFEFTSAERAIPPSDLHYLYAEGKPPPNYKIWVAADNGPLYLHMLRHASFGFPARDAVTSRGDNGLSQSTCIFFGQLIVVVFCTRRPANVRPQAQGPGITEIWPGQAPFKWPPQPVAEWPAAFSIANAVHEAFIRHFRPESGYLSLPPH